MKRIIKNPIFTFILGALIFGGIVGVSAYTILASEIGFTPKDSTWKKSNGENITNVKDAIDELYGKANSSLLNDLIIRQQVTVKGASGRSNATFYFNEYIANNYKYFKIIDKSINNYVNSCSFTAKNKETSENVTLSEETEYIISDYTHMWSDLTSLPNTPSDYARCYYYIELYN